MNDPIAARFASLAEEAEKLISEIAVETRTSKTSVRYSDQPDTYESYKVELIDFNAVTKWSVSARSLLERVLQESSSHCRAFESTYTARSSHAAVKLKRLYAIFQAAREDYEGGYLFNFKDLVHAEVFSNELEQAEYFLNEGHKVPAAVVAGVVLETHLRKLCESHKDVTPTQKLNRMNDDLAKAGAYNKLRADLVRGWAKVRNHAAHGEPDEFEPSHVEEMIKGIRSFIAEA